MALVKSNTIYQLEPINEDVDVGFKEVINSMFYQSKENK